MLGNACSTFCAAYDISEVELAEEKCTGMTSFPMPSAGIRPTRRGAWEVPRLDLSAVE